MSDIIYEADLTKVVALIKAGHTVRHPRVLLEQQLQERGKTACEILRAKGILLTPPPKDGKGFVYVFVAGAHIKVGFSWLDVDARWESIRRHNPVLEKPFYCTAPLGTRAQAVERAAHKALTAHHVSGEWFLCSQEVAIRAVQQAAQELCRA